MTHEEAKQILLLYRPDSQDAADRQVAEALKLAKQSPELSRWLEEHCARQQAIRASLRDIPVPVRLKRSIISCHAARNRIIPLPAQIMLAAALILILLSLAFLWVRPPSDNNFENFRVAMVNVALQGYSMNLETNDQAQIRSFLAEQHSTADYTIPTGLQKVAATGCATTGWKEGRVSMVCFHTGKSPVRVGKSDLWLFVTKKSLIKNLPAGDWPQFAHVGHLMTVSWTEGDNLYLLGTETDRKQLKEYLSQHPPTT